MRFAYVIIKWSSTFLTQTLNSIPTGSEFTVIDNKVLGWPLAKAWNHAVDMVLWNKAYDAVIIMNDDVVLRPDTGELLAWGMLEGQFEQRVTGTTSKYGQIDNYWPHPTAPQRELLLLSARHAHWSDACTDSPDWDMLNAAKPIWQPGPDFSCFCVTRRLGQEIGRFDENFNPAYLEDNDTHRRIQLAGFEAGALAPYWHFLNGTIRSDPERATAVRNSFERCKKYYCEKWGAPLDSGSPIGR